MNPIWGSDFFCVLLWSILYISFYFLYNTNISGIDWLNMGRLVLIYALIYFPGEGTIWWMVSCKTTWSLSQCYNNGKIYERYCTKCLASWSTYRLVFFFSLWWCFFTPGSVGLNYLRQKGSTGITHSDLVLNIKKK